jgi:hypothetical protein
MSHNPFTQDGPLCQTCGQFSIESLQEGFALPRPRDVILPGRVCRLCQFLTSIWPRTLYSIAENPSIGIQLRLEDDKFSGKGSYNQPEKQSRRLSTAPKGTVIVLALDYDGPDPVFDRSNPRRTIGKLILSRDKGKFLYTTTKLSFKGSSDT